MKKNISSELYFFSLLLFILIFIKYPHVCITGAKEGLLLWFEKLLPSLFPFIVLVNSLSSSHILLRGCQKASPFIKKYLGISGQGFFAFILGAIAGYPTGAKVIEKLLSQKQISKKEAENLICFCNNCGPLFIVGTVGVLLLQSTSLGYFLLLIHILSSLSMLLLFKNKKIYTSHSSSVSVLQKSPISLFNESISNAMDAIVHVGGYIIFFSVLVHFLNFFLFTSNEPSFFGFLPVAILEISIGIAHFSSNISNQGLISSLALISGLIGFGGFCVYFQALYFLKDFSLNTSSYLLSKAIQGILSVLYTCILFPLWQYVLYQTPFAFPTWPTTLLILFFSILVLLIKKTPLFFKAFE
jgi:sporulation integral membrane protein YlbJ